MTFFSKLVKNIFFPAPSPNSRTTPPPFLPKPQNSFHSNHWIKNFDDIDSTYIDSNIVRFSASISDRLSVFQA